MTRYAQRTLIQQPTLANWGKAAAGGIGVVQGYGIATGGTSSSITDSVAYTLLSFTTDGTLVVSSAGLFDCLLVAGGGGGSASGGNYGNGGGGGGGGVFRTTVYLDATSYAVTVGAGGTGDVSRGTPSCIAVTSTLTTVGGLTAAGGGCAQVGTNPSDPTGNSGGCGAGAYYTLATQGAGFVGQGFGGGSGNNAGGYAGGGGGGGGSAAVGNNASGTTGGSGGAGKDISTFIGNVATTNYKGGGGGGGGSGANGSAGVGNGAANSGGGGRGSANNTAPAAVNDGYSGVVYVRFKV